MKRNINYKTIVYAKILKTIGLLSISAAAGSDLGQDFVIQYSKVCLGIKNAESLIKDLQNKKLIL